MHGHTGEMNEAFASVDMGNMSVIRSEMQTISSSMTLNQHDLALIPTSIDQMNRRVDSLRRSVVSMDERRRVLCAQMNGINDCVDRITQGIGEMSKRMRMFPWP